MGLLLCARHSPRHWAYSGSYKVCRGEGQTAGRGGTALLMLLHVVDSADAWMLLVTSEGSIYDDVSRHLLVCAALGIEHRASACVLYSRATAPEGRMAITLRPFLSFF